MKKKRARDNRFCALKLDMRKAYDRVEWSYLKAIMIKLGFHRIWVEMTMRLVTMVSFSVLFIGDHLDSFVPTRGIRQGDPTRLVLVSSGGTFVPVKVQNSVIEPQWD